MLKESATGIRVPGCVGQKKKKKRIRNVKEENKGTEGKIRKQEMRELVDCTPSGATCTTFP